MRRWWNLMLAWLDARELERVRRARLRRALSSAVELHRELNRVRAKRPLGAD